MMSSNNPFMVVRLRFANGPLVTRRKGKNSRAAVLAASFLTMNSICLGSLGIWRLCEDLDLASEFFFHDGVLSHWQVWIGAAAVLQYGALRLTKYARVARERTTVEMEREPVASSKRAAANAG